MNLNDLINAAHAKYMAARTVRVEVRNRTITHKFDTVAEAQSFWDRAHKHGMNIDPRPQEA